MGDTSVTVSLPPELIEAIEAFRDAEQTDRSTAITGLLERGIEDWRIETAVREYREGKRSLGRAAERAGVSPWRFLDILDDRGVELNYDVDDLEADIAAVQRE